MNAKKRLFHSFFSLFDKDSISKQDFDKLKQFDCFFPKSFLVDIQNKVIQDNQKEIENKEKENQQMKIEIEDKEKEIEKMKPGFELNELHKIFSDSEIITDIEYVKKLQEWINDNDFFSKMKKGFSAKRDGFNSQNWHKSVDGKGTTLSIIKTKDNFIFGGFTQVGWTNDKSKWNYDGGYFGYMKDPNAFIFSLRNDKGDRDPQKFTINKEREGYAIIWCLSDGPTFGSDFWIKPNLQSGRSNFGNSYNLPDGIKYGTNESYSYLAGSYESWIVDELETYFI